MLDDFAFLGAERGPWVDPEVLKQKFLAASANCHPDKFSGDEKNRATDRFTDLNKAYSTLRETKDRLYHLLELEGISKNQQFQNIPSTAADLLMKTAQTAKKADELIGQKNKASSPVIKAQLFSKAVEITDALQQLQTMISSRLKAIDSEIKEMNALWETAPPISEPGARAAFLPLRRLEELAQEVALLQRSRAQIGEKVNLLAF